MIRIQAACDSDTSGSDHAATVDDEGGSDSEVSMRCKFVASMAAESRSVQSDEGATSADSDPGASKRKVRLARALGEVVKAYLSLKRVTGSKPGTSKPKSRRAAKTKGTTQPKWAVANPGHEHEKCVSRKRLGGKEGHRVR